MTDKELYLDTIYKCDEILDDLIPVQMELHRLVVLMGDSIPNDIMRQAKEADSQIEMVKQGRALAQDMLFAKYQTVVLAKWQEAKP